MRHDTATARDDAEEALRAIVAERAAAVGAKDPVRLAARLADDVVLFDALPPLASQGSAPVDATTRQWFGAYASDIGYDVHDLRVSAAGDVGFCSFVYRVTGTLTTGDEVDMWVRATLGCRRIDGSWRIVHDHESVPFDAETGRALTTLAPESAAAS